MRAITQRQHEFLELALQGLTNQEIADRLIVSYQVAKNVMSSVYKMLPEMRSKVRQARKARATEKLVA